MPSAGGVARSVGRPVPVALFLLKLQKNGPENVIGVAVRTDAFKLRCQFGIVELDQSFGWTFVIRRHEFHA